MDIMKLGRENRDRFYFYYFYPCHINLDKK